MNSGLVLSQADGRPLYLQIMEQIRGRIAVGDWKPGQPIPSIRQLAVELQVSVITIKRAYLELEREGVIVTQHGKGSTVAAGVDVGARIHDEDLGRHLAEAIRLADLLGLSDRELRARLQDALERRHARETT
jgi:GntR family transcriptional regulator